MSFASLASLATATADLTLVRDIIGAMRAADADAAAANYTPAPTVATSQPEYTTIVVRHDAYEACCTETKCPSYRPCNTVATNLATRPPRYAPPHWSQRLALEPASTDGPSTTPSKATSDSPFQPPWAMLPWNEPARQNVQVKIVQLHTDIASKGSLLDMFI